MIIMIIIVIIIITIMFISIIMLRCVTSPACHHPEDKHHDLWMKYQGHDESKATRGRREEEKEREERRRGEKRRRERVGKRGRQWTVNIAGQRSKKLSRGKEGRLVTLHFTTTTTTITTTMLSQALTLTELKQ